MRTDLLRKLAHLSETLDTMFVELGLKDLSANERAVLMAMSAVGEPNEEGELFCATEKARAHPLARRMSQPTFHRTLRSLVQRGWVRKADTLGAGMYTFSVPSPKDKTDGTCRPSP